GPLHELQRPRDAHRRALDHAQRRRRPPPRQRHRPHPVAADDRQAADRLQALRLGGRGGRELQRGAGRGLAGEQFTVNSSRWTEGLAMSQVARHFAELKVYRAAFDLQQVIFEWTRSFPKEERYALTDQVRRSSRAVGASIAEGWQKR